MKELDTVSLRIAAFGFASGTLGTIVHEQIKGEVFLVEFCDERGRTLALEDIHKDELQLICAYKY